MSRVMHKTVARKAVLGFAKSKKRGIRRAKRRAAMKEIEDKERLWRSRAKQSYELIYGTPVNGQTVQVLRPRRKTRPTKRTVMHEWENWAALHPDDLNSPNAGMFFFTYLQEKRPALLNFRSSGDKWQTVHGWLLREGRVKD